MILGAANRDLYGIRPQTLENRLALARKHHTSLKLLAHSNSAFFNQDISTLRILFRQQLFGVWLTHSHLAIIIHRPFLLHNPSVDDEINPVLREEHENNVLECLRASIEMTDHLNTIFKASQFFNGSWVSLFSGPKKQANNLVYSFLWLHGYRGFIYICDKASIRPRGNMDALFQSC